VTSISIASGAAARATGQNLIINSLVATALGTQNISQELDVHGVWSMEDGGWPAGNCRLEVVPESRPMIYAPGCLENMPSVVGV